MSTLELPNWQSSVFEWCQKHLLGRNEAKIFSYDACNIGQTFALETNSDAGFTYMTCQQAGMQAGDWVRMMHPHKTTMYQIQEIEYYEEPSDMWMAKLRKFARSY